MSSLRSVSISGSPRVEATDNDDDIRRQYYNRSVQDSDFDQRDGFFSENNDGGATFFEEPRAGPSQGYGPYNFYPPQPPPFYNYAPPPPGWGPYHWDPRASFGFQPVFQPHFPVPEHPPSYDAQYRQRPQRGFNPGSPRYQPYTPPRRASPNPPTVQLDDDDDVDTLQVLSEWNAGVEEDQPCESANDDGHLGAPRSVLSPIVIPDTICREIAELMVGGVSKETSLSIAKDFALVFETPGFSLKPPKMDDWLTIRAKEKDLLKKVNQPDDTLSKIQFKIMDIGGPLIELYARISENKDEDAEAVRLRRLIRSIVVQWGRAFAHVSKKRRSSAISIVEPSSDFLLKNEGFLQDIAAARESLFTRRFLDSMLTESSNREILDKCDE